MRRRVRAGLCAAALLALAALVLSYRRLVRTVEFAASSAGYVEAT